MKILIPYKGKTRLLNSFEGHKGRIGLVGGSVAKSSTPLSLPDGAERAGLPRDISFPEYDSGLTQALTEGRWKMTAVKDERYSEPMYRVKINPPEQDGVKTVPASFHGDDTGNQKLHYDEKMCKVETDYYTKEKPEDPVGGRNSPVFVPHDGYVKELPLKPEPGFIYRGMSGGELADILESGKISSKGGYNLGDDQKGLSFFSTQPSQAESYAGGFAPWQYSPTFQKPSYIIKVKADGDVPIGYDSTTTERSVPNGKLTVDDIHEIVEVKPYAIESGDVDIYKDYSTGGKFKEGSRGSPSTWLCFKSVYKKPEPLLNSFNPDESRDENGRWVVGGVTVRHGEGDAVKVEDADVNNHHTEDKFISSSVFSEKTGLPIYESVYDKNSKSGIATLWSEVYTPKEDEDFKKIDGAIGMAGQRAVWDNIDKPDDSPVNPSAALKDLVASTISKETGESYVDSNNWVKSWAGSSNDHSFDSLVRQNAAEDVLGAKMSDWQVKSYNEVLKERMEAQNSGTTPDDLRFGLQSTFDGKNDFQPDTECLKASSRLLKQTYSDTQSFFAKMGYNPDDEITLFRGASTPTGFAVGDYCNMERNALESWTISKKVARNFADCGDLSAPRVVIGAKFKISDIVSTPATGFGCLNEKEIVVHNARDVKGTVLWVS